MCGHFNAGRPSETRWTKTWAEGLQIMYNQNQLLPQILKRRVSTIKVGRQRVISVLQGKVTISYHHDFTRYCPDEIPSRCLTP